MKESIIKKALAVIIAAAAVTSVSACNGQTQPETTTADTAAAETTTKNGTVEEVAVDGEDYEDDTTAEALEYLKTQVPLFADYLETRMTYPVSVISTYNDNGTETEIGVFIKDLENIAKYSKDSSGTIVREIYSVDKGYQIDDVNKLMYIRNCGSSFVRNYIKSNLMSIPVEDAMMLTYTEQNEEYNGTEYICDTLYSDGEPVSKFYFDKDTKQIKYMLSGTVVMTFTEVERGITNESWFDIPTGYEERTFDDLLREQGFYDTQSSQ